MVARTIVKQRQFCTETPSVNTLRSGIIAHWVPGCQPSNPAQKPLSFMQEKIRRHPEVKSKASIVQPILIFAPIFFTQVWVDSHQKRQSFRSTSQEDQIATVLSGQACWICCTLSKERCSYTPNCTKNSSTSTTFAKNDGNMEIPSFYMFWL